MKSVLQQATEHNGAAGAHAGDCLVHKRAPSERPIHDLIARRWSTVAFDADRAVPRDLLLTVMEAARWAPSCFGDEPWRYLVWDRHADLEGWQRAFDCLSPGNHSWARQVPVLMLACADSVFQKNGKPNRWGMYDTGAASENICLQATALGMMAHQMGGFDSDKIRAAFTIPAAYTPMAMIAIGYQAAVGRMDADLQSREREARVRKPLGERFFAGQWGKGIV